MRFVTTALEVNVNFGTIAEWVFIGVALIGGYIHLRERIESVSHTCLRKEELRDAMRDLERHFDIKFTSLKEVIEERLRHTPH